MQITFRNLCSKDAGLQDSGQSNQLAIDDWQIEEGASWGLFCGHGEIGDALALLLCGDVSYSGELVQSGGTVTIMSLAEQQMLLEKQIENDESDFLDRVDHGTSVYQLVDELTTHSTQTNLLLELLDLKLLAQSGFRMLSTGETRRVMLARALAVEPDLLILDNPFTGLDVAHRRTFSSLLQSLSQQRQMLMVFSREEDVPNWLPNIALFDHKTLLTTMSAEQWQDHPILAQIKAQSAQRTAQQTEQLAELLRRNEQNGEVLSAALSPIFQITHGKVAYTEKTIFEGLNWRIDPGQHWQIKGPNGSGKSTLLSMIFGDHPQCYSNDIVQFGRKRGSGETVWEIKQHIGMVSSALHLQYRVNCSALEVVLSGYFDSIGLYQQPTKKQREQASQWLSVLKIDEFARTPFRQLDYGQQRLLLIARALVTNPTLLILDEPYQGLDFFGRRLIKSTIELIARENLSQVLYVSHYQADAIEAITHQLELVYKPERNCYHGHITG